MQSGFPLVCGRHRQMWVAFELQSRNGTYVVFRDPMECHKSDLSHLRQSQPEGTREEQLRDRDTSLRLSYG